MSKFILGKKIGMTSIINEDGNLVPVTVIEAGPCVVTQVKGVEKDGYKALQIGIGTEKKPNKPLTGHTKKSGVASKTLKEFRIGDDIEMKEGDIVDVSIFEKGEKVKIAGNIKAKGFQGGIKRWGFKSHPAGHGHPQQRRVGSIGSGYPQHVFKGKKMPGRCGPDRKTILGLTIVDVDVKNNLLLVKGSVPGVKGRLLEIRG
ncbi:MAG TPA: 50S ribosomal protein L3 [Patescibacteria group bacterium]|nr:50S ribosomal protein L3 [Patescibacteria group bacterium]